MRDEKKSVVANALHKAIDKAFPSRGTRMHSGLLMLSGGLDSVALLVNLLEETDQKLHVHHIEIQNFENRLRAENDALERVLTYCREHYRGSNDLGGRERGRVCYWHGGGRTGG